MPTHRKFIVPGPEEDAAIAAGIAADPDTYVMGDAEFAKARQRGRPPVAIKRPTMTMRIDPDILAALKASGKGWQTRVNDLLRKEVLGNPPRR